MGTRGIIFVRKELRDPKDRLTYQYRGTYNHMDSYPSCLGRKLYEVMRDNSCKKGKNRLNFDKEGFKKFENDILSGGFNNERNLTGMTPEDIDYLFHEWIYVVSRSGFQIWKSNSQEERLHYCGWVSSFHEPKEAEHRISIGDARKRVNQQRCQRTSETLRALLKS